MERNKMLSSPRKIQKLFIKFTAWRKMHKAMNLLTTYPEIIMPWEKAFIEAIQNKAYNSIVWLYKEALSRGIILDIHYNHDHLYQEFCKLGYIQMIEWLFSCDTTYKWNETATILIENSPNRMRIMNVLEKWYSSNTK